MPTIDNSARAALVRALTNDPSGVVSARDALKLLDAGVREIKAADDPQATFDSNARFIEAARAVVGSDPATTRVLDSYPTLATTAVHARLEALTGGPVLPAAIKDAFDELVRYGGVPGGTEASISNVVSDVPGYRFDYEAGGTSGSAWALRYEGEHVLSPVHVPSAVLNQARELMRQHFDAHFADNLRQSGASDAEIAEARAAIRPVRVHFPGDDDPIGLSDSYPLVISMRNDSGSDHGFFVGIDPADGSGEAGDFN